MNRWSAGKGEPLVGIGWWLLAVLWPFFGALIAWAVWRKKAPQNANCFTIMMLAEFFVSALGSYIIGFAILPVVWVVGFVMMFYFRSQASKVQPSTFAQPSVQAPLTSGAQICQNCGSLVPIGKNFCPNCGAQQQLAPQPQAQAPPAPPAGPRFCPSCGSQVSAGEKFCGSCGGQV